MWRLDFNCEKLVILSTFTWVLGIELSPTSVIFFRSIYLLFICLIVSLCHKRLCLKKKIHSQQLKNQRSSQARVMPIFQKLLPPSHPAFRASLTLDKNWMFYSVGVASRPGRNTKEYQTSASFRLFWSNLRAEASSLLTLPALEEEQSGFLRSPEVRMQGGGGVMKKNLAPAFGLLFGL